MPLETLPAHVIAGHHEDHVAFRTAAICPGCGERIWVLCQPSYRRKLLRVMDLPPFLWTSRTRDSWKSAGANVKPVSTRCTLGGSCVFACGDDQTVRAYLDALPRVERAGLPLGPDDLRDVCRDASIRAMHAAKAYLEFLGVRVR